MVTGEVAVTATVLVVATEAELDVAATELEDAEVEDEVVAAELVVVDVRDEAVPIVMTETVLGA